MIVEYKKGVMRIVAEDLRDEAYLEDELKARSRKKVYARVSDGRFEDGLVIEVLPYTDPSERPQRADQRFPDDRLAIPRVGH